VCERHEGFFASPRRDEGSGSGSTTEEPRGNQGKAPHPLSESFAEPMLRPDPFIARIHADFRFDALACHFSRLRKASGRRADFARPVRNPGWRECHFLKRVLAIRGCSGQGGRRSEGPRSKVLWFRRLRAFIPLGWFRLLTFRPSTFRPRQPLKEVPSGLVPRASSSSPFDEMKEFLRLARCARPMERARIFFPTAALLVGHESRFAPSSRLAFGKNLARERQRSFRAGH
jgi:hypothetical protein